MAITAKAGGASNPVSAGVHLAVCTRIIDLGTQFSQMYGNSQHKVMIGWEVPDDTITIDGEEKPKMISKEYTLSLNEKASLRKDLEAWRNKQFTDEELNGFDLVNILGKSCQLQVLHSEKGYPRIGAIMALPKGTNSVAPVTETIYFDLGDDSCFAIMDKLPEWIKDKIKAAPEYLNRSGAQVDTSEDEFTAVDDDGDLPF